MADPKCIVPYRDPFDETTYCESFFNFDDNVNLNIDDLNHVSSFTPQICDDGYIEDVIEPYDDPNLWDFCFDSNLNDNTEMTRFDVSCDGGTINQYEANNEIQYINSMQEFASPVSSVRRVFCSCCQVLREIIHTNGKHTMKLEIHGRLGMICHAVLENLSSNNMVHLGNKQHHMFDFCMKSLEEVKQFLIQYCEDRRQGGYIMVQDPLAIYYEALCVGLDWDDNLITDDYFEQSPPISGDGRMSYQETQNENEGIYKISLSVQRERTGKLTLSDMANCFHLPIEEAAKQLNVCPTVVKKICRRNGLTRWPHRKIKSLQRQILTLRDNLSSAFDVGEKARIEADIVGIQQQIANYCGGIYPSIMTC